VLDNTDKGVELVQQVKRDFPETKQGKNADEVLKSFKQQEESKKVQRALVAGSKFPDFDEKDVAGKPLSVANYKGKVVLIDFWAKLDQPDAVYADHTWMAFAGTTVPALMSVSVPHSHRVLAWAVSRPPISPASTNRIALRVGFSSLRRFRHSTSLALGRAYFPERLNDSRQTSQVEHGGNRRLGIGRGLGHETVGR